MRKINILMKKNIYKNGSGLVEILVAVFVFSIIVGSLITASSLYLVGAKDNLISTKGAYLAEEGIEAVKTIRDSGWSNISSLSDDSIYYLYFDISSSTNNVWRATTTPKTIDSIYTRTFKVNSVYRDSSGRIQTSGAFDINTEKLTVLIFWQSKGNITTKNLVTYIANIL